MRYPVPSSLWKMTTPMLSLNVEKACNLPRADLLGSSDPVALVYVGINSEPSCKTKTVQNNLNPVWNEKFNLSFSIGLELGVTTAADFPIVRIEVWDMNLMGLGELLLIYI